jgi:hypothetical protein
MAAIPGRGFDFRTATFSAIPLVKPIGRFPRYYLKTWKAPMHESKIAEYRAEAAACIAHANLNAN